MEFGPLPLDAAIGAIVAHSVRGEGFSVKKGARLRDSDAAAMRAAGVTEVIVAQIGRGDVAEDEAAHDMAEAACGPGLSIDRAFTGRCNLRATADGVLRVCRGAIDKANAVDESLTIATPPDYTRLAKEQLAATAKVIPYATDGLSYTRVVDWLQEALELHAFQPLRTTLIVTRNEGQKDSIITKGIEAIAARLRSLGSPEPEVQVVPHNEASVRDALGAVDAPELTLILGGSATSDRRDVAPGAVVAAGGEITRFGMPVDPGNLLALGSYKGAPLVILPGCARSPALNGADWVLERLAARLPVTGEDIAAMGVGGLLKEIPSRPQPREIAKRPQD